MVPSALAALALDSIEWSVMAVAVAMVAVRQIAVTVASPVVQMLGTADFAAANQSNIREISMDYLKTKLL